MTERSYRVLSAVGPDRPGLVAALTAAIAGRGGNVEDSHMAVLGGAFGIMMLVSGGDRALAELETAAARLEAETGLRIHLEPTSAPAAGGGIQRFVIAVEAADREGIVHAISSSIYELGGNIANLASAIYPAPHTGAPLFRLELTVDLPGEVEPETLRRVLDELASAENLDCTLRPAAEA